MYRSVPDEDRRLGQLLRLMRRRLGKTQAELADLARVPCKQLMRVEAGRVGDVRFDYVRRLFDAAGGRARIWSYYNGAAADRLVDERHAALAESACRICGQFGWQTLLEVSFAEFGERGSIDVLAAHERRQAIAVQEVKSAFGSIEEMNRSLDVKVRLAPRIARARLGWTPRHVGRILVVPRDTTVRRHVQRFAATMDSLYPGRTADVRAWLRRPRSDLAAIWFVDERRATLAG